MNTRTTGSGTQQSHRLTVSRHAVEHAAQGRAHSVRLRDVVLQRRGHDRPGRQRLDGEGIEAAMAASLPRRGHMVVGDFDDDRWLRRGVQPAFDAAHDAEPMKLRRQVGRAA